ncbi:MAG: site-specific DNA-methyltransferase [Rhodoferax sp.]|nr:site-specific DNA-methyltransferase [Rhodoferax sp.]
MATQFTPVNTSADTTAQSRFLSLLKQDILKLDAAELDFGIYRILNYRRVQVLAYLDDTLPSRIALWCATLALDGGQVLAHTESANCYYHLHTFFSRYWDEGDFIPRARRGGSAAYAVPYNGQDTHFHWATKGSHYIKSGELFSRFAYKDGSGEVRFSLERADVEKDNAKGSTKHFFPATFKTVNGGFELQWQWRTATDAEAKRYKNKSASNSKDEGNEPNLPESSEDGDAIESDAAFSADFSTEGNTLQDRILHAWLAGVDFKAAAPPTGLDPDMLARNARRFVRKNTSDFFVHPQLGDFLRGELEVYLKHEFVQVWDAQDAELPRIRAKFKLVRSVAQDLITFLDQIERFQATLFEKRKFVLQADYLVQCSWLLRQPGAVGLEGQKLVDEACASPEQVKEWASWVGDKTKKPSGKKLLTTYPHLPLHTRHFAPNFKARVLACFDDIEAALGGELVHADNYAALRTLEPAYRERVKCIYIDPPYNTDASPIDYKNGFRESSWLSLMDRRVHCAMGILHQAGVLCIAIDDAENAALRLQLEHDYPETVLGTVAVRANPSGRPTKAGFSVSHEYVHFVGRSTAATIGKMNPTEDQAARFSEEDADGVFEWRNLRREGSNSDRSARRALFYPLYVSDIKVRIPEMTWDDQMEEWLFEESPNADEATTWPIDDKGNEKTWRWGFETVRDNMKDIAVRKDRSGKNYVYYKRRPNEEGVVAVTTWFDSKYSATEHGTALLKKLFGKPPFSYPKSIYAVQDSIYVGGANRPDSITLDFFAGSATTGHAVINLNREDGGTRKFLLVEQGEYFDTVTLPRIAKVMTAPEWKDGLPKDTVQHSAADKVDKAGAVLEAAADHWSRRTLPLVRVLRLERYEDSLNALDLEQSRPLALTEQAQTAMNLVAHDAGEHLLRYWLMDSLSGDGSTADNAHAVRLSTSQLTHPFDYQLTLHEPTGCRVVAVDMLETARLLLGLVPRRQMELQDAQGQRHQLMLAVMAAELARDANRSGSGISTRLPAKPVLLWLRTVDDERSDDAAQAEYAWLLSQVQAVWGLGLSDFGTIFHNRSAFWPAGVHATSLDSVLAQRMMERARGASHG